MADDFAVDGALALGIPGFKPREAQREMAQAVSEAVKEQGELVVEAGTGTGKTYAYLAPALRANKKVDCLDRIQSAAGSALWARSAYHGQGAEVQRQNRAAERPL